MQLGEARILESVKQLFQVFTNKRLFIEWLLEVNIYYGKKLSKAKAVYEANDYAYSNDSIDMRTVPVSVKRNMIHDEAVLKMRWDLCQGCEFLKDDKCQKCGCFMKVKHKLVMASCPEGKWGKYVA